MLASINVWADVIAAAMIVAAALFWIVQLAGNSLTGRFKQKFRFGQWPEHDEIIPVFPRAIHFLHVFNMILLAVSGLYIRFPFYPGLKPMNQMIHHWAMYAVIIFTAIRVGYAILFDRKSFALTRQDLKVIPQALMYYMFIRKQYPHISKYNGMQKFTYGYAFPTLITLLAITGFAMFMPDQLLGWTGAIGSAAAYARVLHFFLAATIVMFTLIHMCLSFVEDFPALLIFFGLRRQYWEEDYDEYYEEDDGLDESSDPDAEPAPEA
jgi:cytochrome b subunit of formate dehydrogenase